MPTYFNYITLENEDIQFAVDIYLIQISPNQYRFKAVPEFSEYISKDVVSRVEHYWVIHSEVLHYLKNNQNFNWDRCYSAAEVRLIMEGPLLNRNNFGTIPAYIQYATDEYLLWMLEHSEIEKRFILLKIMQQVTSANEVTKKAALDNYRNFKGMLNLLNSCLQENSVAAITRTVDILTAIADHHKPSCRKIYNTIIIEQAIKLLNHPSPLVQKSVLNFLQNLVMTYKKSSLGISVKGMDIISRVLIELKEEILKEWIFLTLNLLIYAKKSYLSLYKAGIIPLLMMLLEKNDAQMNLNSMLILTNFAQSKGFHQALFESNAVERGINYLNDDATSCAIKEEASLLLIQLCAHHKPSYERCCSILKTGQCVSFFYQFPLEMKSYAAQFLVNLAFHHYMKSQETLDDKSFFKQMKLWQDTNLQYGCVEQSLGISSEDETTVLETIAKEIQRRLSNEEGVRSKRRNEFFQEAESASIDNVIAKRARTHW